MPVERVLPYMEEKQFAKVDVNQMMSKMSVAQADDMPWEQIGAKITPKQVENISPGTVLITINYSNPYSTCP